jgi:predicted  nucleic acid-binding Zn-ribbon protein
MEEQLAALKRLQRIDEELSQLLSRARHLPERVAAAKKDAEEREGGLRQAQEQLQHHRREIDRQELELRSREEHVTRLRGQLIQVKTNREYQAMLTEIQSFETDASRLEESILEAMGEMDGLAAELKRLGGLVEESRREVAVVEQVVAQEGQVLEGGIAELQRRRAEVTGLVTPENRAIYERLRAGLPGRVLVPVAGQDCQGCHMPLRPQALSELMLNKVLLTCHRCGRILYLPENWEPPEPTEE